MRTTLTIDDGLLRQLRQKALDTGKPFKLVVNETLRAGLEKPATAARPRYVCPTFSTGPPRSRCRPHQGQPAGCRPGRPGADQEAAAGPVILIDTNVWLYACLSDTPNIRPVGPGWRTCSVARNPSPCLGRWRFRC
jgi:hypothetical protein